MNAPSKIHLTTRCYLKGWTEDGQLRPVDRRYGPLKLKAPSAVAYERDWWSKTNPQLNAFCEQQCEKIETLVPDLLGRVRTSWPLDFADRAVLAQFVALHVFRTPAFLNWFTAVREKSLLKFRDRFSSEAGYAQFCERMRSDGERAKKVLRLNKAATLLGSMHWTLVVFEDPILATSGQPVAPVPLLDDGQREIVSAMPDRGWLETIEVRFPLSPREALLGTWYGARDDTPPVKGTWADAVAINGVTRAQAQRYYHSPAMLPAMPPAILRYPAEEFEPLSPKLLPGYSTQAARSSERRDRAAAEVKRLVEQVDETTLTLIVAEPASIAA